MLSRESMRVAKSRGGPPPWTLDSVLNECRFTNVHRKHDRGTAYLHEQWMAAHVDASASTVLVNCAVYRIFGTTGFAHELGWTASVGAFSVDKAVAAAESRASRVVARDFLRDARAHVAFRGNITLIYKARVVEGRSRVHFGLLRGAPELGEAARPRQGVGAAVQRVPQSPRRRPAVSMENSRLRLRVCLHRVSSEHDGACFGKAYVDRDESRWNSGSSPNRRLRNVWLGAGLRGLSRSARAPDTGRIERETRVAVRARASATRRDARAETRRRMPRASLPTRVPLEQIARVSLSPPLFHRGETHEKLVGVSFRRA